ncbi:hypothetical protein EDC94DRAFT_594920 [Helicostylum pulchrum]|nr:hypothetical protein EDC94DRAFT_594920 [Helicostylum pulchrum]
MFLIFLALNLFAGLINPLGFREMKKMIDNNGTKHARFLIEIAAFLEVKVAQLVICYMFQQLQLSNHEDWPLKIMKDGL